AEFPQKRPCGSSGGAGSLSRVRADGHTGIPKELLNHMKRSLALIVTLASGFVLSAAAQTPAATAAAPGPAKIAVIAFQVAVAQTNEGQRNFADLQTKFDPRRQQLKVLSDEIDGLTKQLQAGADKMPPAEQQSKATAIDTKKTQLDRDGQDATNDFQQAMQDVYNALASKVYDVMQSYRSEEHTSELQSLTNL